MSHKRLLMITTLFILLSACNLPSGSDETEQSPSATVRAEQTPSNTLVATSSTQEQPAVTSTTATSSSGASPTPGMQDDATFGGDITIPDYTFMAPGESFTKTWRLRNTGDSTWTTSYQLIFDEGDQMGGADSVPFQEIVLPGESIDISVDLTAPDDPGGYTGFWMLRNAAGELFGVGENADQSIFVIITVVEEDPQSSNTPAPTGGPTITGATLNASNANYSGECSVDLIFTGVISSTGTGTFTYTLVPTAQTPGFEWFPPGPIQASYSTGGAHSLDIAITLTIDDSVVGSANLQITGSNNFTSNTVNFNISCED
ncbi:MAG: hypothetical protein FVQ83_00245 [Chloroflexi bacterium]|nr:hypothetical protein [Chloroflexota bacterium]